ncbi:hypothetical protein FDENT_1110 [Fusarium denticulatum]|uniref:Zn(2)-C6 fungal-type domain-containing protein n=1 Tax=Fusarium denticulatum TaxID=48507 RepID=A0A8H6CW91_9HYPO|nr:hypothetical protein FDENT_1110 [Fusarium denticulatum]
MNNALSSPESRIFHVDGDISQVILSRLPSENPSLGQSLPGDNADVSTSTSSSSPSSLPIGRPRRRPIPRKGHTKSRWGCLNCKRRRVKCQETTPSCDNCNRLNLRCEYPQTSVKGLITLPLPQPTQALSQAQLSMVDLRFFHHFLLHAYPGLPIQGEEVWKEVAKYSHGFDFLAHSMLALGASHLGLCNGNDYNSGAISHRIKAIKSLNSALSTPCQTKEEGDARYATLMALTWQSSYMADGMQEFLSMLRGCTIVSKSSVFRFEDSVFRMFSIDGHVQRVNDINNGFDRGLSDDEAIDTGIASIKAIAPLSQSTLELSLIADLQSILEMSRTTCVCAFGAVCRAYQLFGEASDSDFLTISDSDNHVSQIIMAHFFAIEYVFASIALVPVSPSFPFRKTIITAWILRVKRQVPASYGAYIEWPLEFISKANGDWGIKPSYHSASGLVGGKIIDKYDFNRTYHGIAISEQWQAWETAHFFRVRSIIENPTVGARLISYGCDNGDGSPLNWIVQCTLGADFEKFNSLNVFRKVRDCAWASCSDSTYGRCTSSLQGFKCGTVSPDNIAKFGRVMAKPYCQAASAGIDLDIAGQGIVTAYVIQLVLVLFLGLCFKLTTSWIRTFGRMSSSFQKDSVFRETCQRWQTTLSETRFAKAESSAMLDFQESQALFAATISITAIITFDGENRAGLANMLTLFSWMFNHRILQGLITTGIFPVLMAQLVMHRAGERRFYTLFFVVLSWILMTIITEFQDFNADAFEEHLKQVSTVDACGGNPGPMSFCQGIKEKNSYDFFNVTMACRFFTHIIASCLIIDWALHFAKTRMEGDKIKYTQIGGDSRTILSFAETKGAKLSLGVFWAAIELLTVIMIFIGLREMVELLDMHSSNDGLPTWGFGQLVAVAIWSPVMIKFVCLGIFGPKREVEQKDNAHRPPVLEMTSYSQSKANNTTFVSA